MGREFQREGAAMVKALSPQVRCLVLSGGERLVALERRLHRSGGYGGIVAVEKFCEVGRSLVMEGFVGEEEDFKMDAF